MALMKCKMCGGDLDIEAGSTIATCEYCGSVQTIPSADNEKKMSLFARANRLRYNCEFDKAHGVYEAIAAEFPEEAEAYWGLVLCKYGIEYVDDPATGKRIPTCRRTTFDCVLEDHDFEQVMETADPIAKKVYRTEAKQIEELRKSIIAISSREEPYDIFICYKEISFSGDRTLDSVLAQDIYDQLTAEGYRVFFSRITLEDKLGVEYEPYIFAALNSAKIMLAVGTEYDHYNAVWVKNEWSRYLQLIEAGQKKVLIPCYKNIDAYDMPKEFARLQAQDLGKVGAMQDLLRGIKKILQPQHSAPVMPKTYASSPVDPLIRRIFMFLEDENWESADEYCEKALDMDPENAQVYVCKLLAERRLRTQDALGECDDPFTDSDHYRKAMRFASDELRATLDGYLSGIHYRAAEKQLADAQTAQDYAAAADAFRSISDREDAKQKVEQITQILETATKKVEELSTEYVESLEAAETLPRLRGELAALCQSFHTQITTAETELNTHRHALENRRITEELVQMNGQRLTETTEQMNLLNQSIEQLSSKKITHGPTKVAVALQLEQFRHLLKQHSATHAQLAKSQKANRRALSAFAPLEESQQKIDELTQTLTQLQEQRQEHVSKLQSQIDALSEKKTEPADLEAIVVQLRTPLHASILQTIQPELFTLIFGD